MRLLLIHHTDHHFDTLLAARQTLMARHDVVVWSKTLHRLGRRALAARMDLALHEAGADYDGIVVITADASLAPAVLGEEVGLLLRRRPVVRLLHRFAGVREPGSLHLFGGAPLPFIPVDCGVPLGPRSRRAAGGARSLLVQGNIEPRRDYAVLPRLAASCPELSINVVGIGTTKLTTTLDGVNVRRNLDELDFHRACAASDFIAPLIDPRGFARYFSDRFTSAVMISLAYGLPAIAHEDLFALYPLHGLRYRDEAGLFACAKAAARLDDAAVAQMAADANRAAAILQARNRDHFEIALAEAGARPGAS